MLKLLGELGNIYFLCLRGDKTIGSRIILIFYIGISVEKFMDNGDHYIENSLIQNGTKFHFRMDPII